jgi:excinuclease ABC subunit A
LKKTKVFSAKKGRNQSYSVENLDPKQYILVKGARVNNLKNIDVAIPRNKLVVITGVSGSGKSSLAFDTLFAEGQRMYVESLSAYARQFLGRMEKPAVDFIRGISPAIAIEQKVGSRNPRSTVGTSTEIYDYLKLLFSRIGKTYSPISGKLVKRDRPDDVVAFLLSRKEGSKYVIKAKLTKNPKRSILEELNILLSKGFSRIMIAEDEIAFIEDVVDRLQKEKKTDHKKQIEIIIDRGLVKADDPDFSFKINDGIQTAFFEGHGECRVWVEDKTHIFSDKFEADGIRFEEPLVNFFSFNNPHGACRRCEGFGKILGIDPNLVIPDESKSVFEGGVAAWKGEVLGVWKDRFISHAEGIGFPIHRPIKNLGEKEKEILWEGSGKMKGINAFFKYVESKLHKIQYRVLLSRYRGKRDCPECSGTRLRKDAGYVKIGGKSIIDLVLMPIDHFLKFFQKLKLDAKDKHLAERILDEIKFRLHYLMDVGLTYLTLNRLTASLSGGEYQRIKLATSLGSSLVGSMYVLDEPSIGLHPRDTRNLIEVLRKLQRVGNTVIVVEHEEEIMRSADEVIDIGPDAGVFGGKVVFQGTLKKLNGQSISHTIDFLSGKDRLELPKNRRKPVHFFEIKGSRINNLKNLDVKFPLQCMTVVTGVSGSGKSSLVKDLVYPSLRKVFDDVDPKGAFDSFGGSTHMISQVEYLDQNPIGKSSRSNPVTYVKGFDPIRELFANQSGSKARGYKAAMFSFNVDGGRCDMCQGEGVTKIEMQFMADIELTCESCGGKRFKEDVLEITYNGKNISEVLELSISEAMEFFQDQKQIAKKLHPLDEVGLGYVKLGQSSSTLSGGEAQRVKLASFLGKSSGQKGIVFLFDEPTTGLHFHDIAKLLKSLNALIEVGHTVIIIEHNIDVISSADWVIDLGPEGGEKGGELIFSGSPEDLVKNGKGYTAKFLKPKLRRA